MRFSIEFLNKNKNKHTYGTVAKFRLQIGIISDNINVTWIILFSNALLPSCSLPLFLPRLWRKSRLKLKKESWNLPSPSVKLITLDVQMKSLPAAPSSITAAKGLLRKTALSTLAPVRGAKTMGLFLGNNQWSLCQSTSRKQTSMNRTSNSFAPQAKWKTLWRKLLSLPTDGHTSPTTMASWKPTRAPK